MSPSCSSARRGWKGTIALSHFPIIHTRTHTHTHTHTHAYTLAWANAGLGSGRRDDKTNASVHVLPAATSVPSRQPPHPPIASHCQVGVLRYSPPLQCSHSRWFSLSLSLSFPSFLYPPFFTPFTSFALTVLRAFSLAPSSFPLRTSSPSFLYPLHLGLPPLSTPMLHCPRPPPLFPLPFARALSPYSLSPLRSPSLMALDAEVDGTFATIHTSHRSVRWSPRASRVRRRSRGLTSRPLRVNPNLVILASRKTQKNCIISSKVPEFAQRKERTRTRGCLITDSY